ncbi:MAG: lamin tail domain-containing protein [Polyangiaceae bacterium]
MSCIVACTTPVAEKAPPYRGAPGEYGSGPEEDPIAQRPDSINVDSGAFVGNRPNDGGIESDAGRPDDAGRREGGTERADAGAEACDGPLAAGDLAIVELMIASASGSGDRGEWIEIQNTRDCSLNLKGLRIESPRGTSAKDGVDLQTDLILPAHGLFVVADSAVASENGDLPGTVVAFANGPADVLKNDGDTITLTAGGVTVDALTYPALTITPGRSVSFPADCPWSDRSNFARWSQSFRGYGPAQADGGVRLQGTPNGENVDVACF